MIRWDKLEYRYKDTPDDVNECLKAQGVPHQLEHSGYDTKELEDAPYSKKLSDPNDLFSIRILLRGFLFDCLEEDDVDKVGKDGKKVYPVHEVFCKIDFVWA